MVKGIEGLENKGQLDKVSPPWKGGGDPFLNPYRLVSLMDLLQVYAEDYIHIGEIFAKIDCIFRYVAKFPLTEEDYNALKELLENQKGHCDKINLRVSSALLSRAINDPPQSHRELKILFDAIHEEISTTLFVFIPQQRAEYYEKEIKLDKFKEASKELNRAGKCYALGEYTASVFHSIRAAEYGLRALAHERQVALPKGKPLEWGNWGEIIKAVETKAAEIDTKARPGAAKDAALEFYRGALGEYRAFNVYRTPTMHTRGNYGESEAGIILQRVQEFLKRLATRISEKTRKPINWKLTP